MDTAQDFRLIGGELDIALEDAGERGGFYHRLGDAHAVLFLENDSNIFDTEASTLFVSFAEAGEDDLSFADVCPVGCELHKNSGYAQLCFVSEGRTWFRDDAIYALFDQMVDEEFFEGFDQIIFYGAGAGGYAAAAFSVAAPGSIVLAFNPQATLNADDAVWDTRFPEARRLDFVSRYGYAPYMSDGAERVYVFFDPYQKLDTMHAMLFRGDHVSHMRCRFMGSDTEQGLQSCGVLLNLIAGASNGTLTPLVFYNLIRNRKNDAFYLRRLVEQSRKMKRPYLTAMATRKVLQQTTGRFFRRALQDAMKQLTVQGRTLPEPLLKKAA